MASLLIIIVIILGLFVLLDKGYITKYLEDDHSVKQSSDAHLPKCSYNIIMSNRQRIAKLEKLSTFLEQSYFVGIYYSIGKYLAKLNSDREGEYIQNMYEYRWYCLNTPKSVISNFNYYSLYVGRCITFLGKLKGY